MRLWYLWWWTMSLLKWEGFLCQKYPVRTSFCKSYVFRILKCCYINKVSIKIKFVVQIKVMCLILKLFNVWVTHWEKRFLRNRLNISNVCTILDFVIVTKPIYKPTQLTIHTLMILTIRNFLSLSNQSSLQP